MNTVTLLLSLFVGLGPDNPATARLPRDLRVELPRDLRIILFGVPSIKPVKAVEEGLRDALREYEQRLAGAKLDKAKLERDNARLCFRLGKFDQALAALLAKLREQERFKGLEEYRALARELAGRAEALGEFCGDSPQPVVQEGDGDETAPPKPADLTKQLKAALDRIDATLGKIELAVTPDEQRAAELEKEISSIGQLGLQLKTLVDQLKAVATEEGEIRIDVNEIIQGVQSVVDTLRERRLERERREQKDPKEPTDPSKQRSRRRQLK